MYKVSNSIIAFPSSQINIAVYMTPCMFIKLMGL